MYCDGNRIKLNRDIQNIMILNINYWGGGAYNLWNNKEDSDRLQIDNQSESDTSMMT